jgi:hypothetical protein
LQIRSAEMPEQPLDLAALLAPLLQQLQAGIINAVQYAQMSAVIMCQQPAAVVTVASDRCVCSATIPDTQIARRPWPPSSTLTSGALSQVRNAAAPRPAALSTATGRADRSRTPPTAPSGDARGAQQQQQQQQQSQPQEPVEQASLDSPFSGVAHCKLSL